MIDFNLSVTIMRELPPYTPGEEVVNVATHLLALVYMLIMSKVTISKARREGNSYHIVGRWLYCVLMNNMFLNSVIYHSLTNRDLKVIWRYVDHISVFMALVATACPFLLQIKTPFTVVTVTALWTLGIFGSVAKIINFDKFEEISTAYYTVLGFLVSFSPQRTWFEMPVAATGWFFTGSFIHLGGAYFYALSEEVQYSHAVFHVISIIATYCHLRAMNSLIPE